MTKEKKNLTWKLKESPTAEGIANLVREKVISPEEGREILLGSAENDKEKIEALEKLVEFLQDLVKDLSKRQTSTTFVPYTRIIEYEGPRRYWEKYWLSTSKVLGESGFHVASGSYGGINKSILSTAGYNGVVTTNAVNTNTTDRLDSVSTYKATLTLDNKDKAVS